MKTSKTGFSRDSGVKVPEIAEMIAWWTNGIHAVFVRILARLSAKGKIIFIP
jgi:hypothetical protein